MNKRVGLLAVAMIAALSAAPAAAVPPPDIGGIPLTTPEDPTPAAPVPMKQKSQCATSATLDGSNFDRPSPANVAFAVDRLHEFATGKGVTVAVIDSGVTPNSRLPRLVGGGDYIGTTNGLEDCDHHGTLVAGIIGAQPSTADGFVGVAPDANLISIRQTSAAYEPADRDRDETPVGSSTLSTLAKAVVHAAKAGADVINLSVTACFPAAAFVDTSDIAAALKYAVDIEDAVVITSAGNADSDSCVANPPYNAGNAEDPRNWDGVHHISMPSFYTPLVLSVGGSTLTGNPYGGTMAGPWISVAAPAVDIVSLDPTKGDSGGLTNGSVGKDGVAPINGTSFSAAYVAGLAALMRQQFPDLSAREVMARIVGTAHTSGEGSRHYVGAGVVDPVAALTYQAGDIAAPPASAPQSRTDSRSNAATYPHLLRDTIVGIVVAACVLVVVAAVLLRAVTRAGRAR